MSISNISSTEAMSIASVLQQPAEEFGNDPKMEIHWAMKAYHHAETYFKLITAVDPALLKLTKADDIIYESFRKDFHDFDVKKLDEDEIKSTESKAKWRTFLNQFELKVEDWNMGTLLRLDAAEDVSDAKATLVPRIQFLAIEIARNREGINTAALHPPKAAKS